MDRSTRSAEEPQGFSRTKRPGEGVKRKVILVVDDDPDTLDLVESIGRKAGYRVFGAASGKECLSLFPRLKPQLMVLDVNMAELDGFETCGRVRNDPNGVHVPIAFLTARKTIDDAKRGVAVGADDCVVRPFDAAQLIGRIEFMTSCSTSEAPLVEFRAARRLVAYSAATRSDLVKSRPGRRRVAEEVTTFLGDENASHIVSP